MFFESLPKGLFAFLSPQDGQRQRQRECTDQRGIGEEDHVASTERRRRDARAFERSGEIRGRLIRNKRLEIGKNSPAICETRGALDDAPRLRREQAPWNRIER
jgi:hypothetical protein